MHVMHILQTDYLVSDMNAFLFVNYLSAHRLSISFDGEIRTEKYLFTLQSVFQNHNDEV